MMPMVFEDQITHSKTIFINISKDQSAVADSVAKKYHYIVEDQICS